MRQPLLEGRLPLPSRKKFVTGIGEHYTKLAERMFKALWRTYLRNKGVINSTYWADEFNNAKVFNIVLMSLSKAGWVNSHSIPARNWAEMTLNEDKLLTFLTPDEVEQTRASHKFQQYILEENKSTLSRATRVNGKVKDTGIEREGFMKAGNTPFQYDQYWLEEYKTPIQLNLTKSMDKIAEMCPSLRQDRASYDTISIEIMDYHLNHDGTFTRGDNYNDSRGRAISSCLSKVANPISCKDFRALLVIPEA